MKRLLLLIVSLSFTPFANAMIHDDTTYNKPTAPSRLTQARKAAQDFEGVMLTKMLKQINEGVKDDPLFPESHDTSLYKEMLIEEHAQILAKKGGLGISEKIVSDMAKADYELRIELEREQND